MKYERDTSRPYCHYSVGRTFGQPTTILHNLTKLKDK